MFDFEHNLYMFVTGRYMSFTHMLKVVMILFVNLFVLAIILTLPFAILFYACHLLDSLGL
jgi:hypothetical protein